LSGSISAYLSGFLSITLITALFMAAGVLLRRLLFEFVPPSTTSFFAGEFLELLFLPVGTGAVIFSVFRRLGGRPASMFSCLKTALGRFLPLIGLALMTALAMQVVGFATRLVYMILGGGSLTCGADAPTRVLLMTPAVLLESVYFVAAPVVMVEKAGPFAAIGRSWVLSRGNLLRIFCALWILWTVQVWANHLLVYELLMGTPMDDTLWVVMPLLDFVFSILVASLHSVLAALAYFRLRIHADGLSQAELVAVFD
jgi:hypothetical protein